ncbi:acyl carrier protein [Nonomuraea sp. KC401]|uniref:acyl carrier protein n=1 Tax=unclassified Nonomuraea TaxID=2593643 RepID=UPI0010FEEB8C|nr:MULTISPECIES: acyl carrier protein [unclassified Nonomuraea]NBE98020.1 hypothetical protein [Nonomuraea sp. K271]TLF60028.1 acyl carrier protein [Nonomuraea sp. KC401]
MTGRSTHDDRAAAAALEEPRAFLTRTINAIAGLDIEPDGNFFEAGLGSLELMRLHESICLWLGREVPVSVVFRHPNLQALARYLAADAPPTARAAPEPATAGVAGPEARRKLRARIQRRRREER